MAHRAKIGKARNGRATGRPTPLVQEEWSPKFSGPDPSGRSYYRTRHGVWVNLADMNVYGLLKLKEKLEEEFRIDRPEYRLVCSEIISRGDDNAIAAARGVRHTAEVTSA